MAATAPVVDRGALARALARRELLDFVKYTKKDYVADRVHAYIAERLTAFVGAVERKESPRLMLFIPPQEGKSELVSRRLPPWVLGKHPEWRVVLVSYGADLAEDMSEDARRCVASDEYRALFPTTALDPQSKAVSDWKVANSVGGMRAIGIGGAVTGRSAEILIIDDPVKGRLEVDRESYREDEWSWWPQARDRVQRGGGIILVLTRWHHDDLAGRLLKLAADNPLADQWEVIRLPALAEADDPLGREEGEPLAPSRHDLADLLNLQANIPPRDWLAKFQQRPTPDEGAIFKREWLRFEPVGAGGGFVVHSWDTAFTTKSQNDYSVCTVWRIERSCYRLLTRWKGRLDYPGVKDMIRHYAAFSPYPANMVLIEAIGTGRSLVQDLRNESRIPITPYKPDRDKVARANAVTGLFASGRVVLPDRASAPWIDDYVDELTTFPMAPHDDSVDSTTQALAVMGVYNAPVIRRRPILRDFVFTPG